MTSDSTKKPIDIIIIAERAASATAELMLLADLFENTATVDLIVLPNARCCVSCRDEIPAGAHHGCNFKGTL